MKPHFSLRTALGRAKGLGSAKQGTAHFIQQRVTAIALLILGLWLIWALLSVGGLTPLEIKAWFRSPVALVGMMLTVFVTLFHSYLGLQVVIEDYVAAPLWKNTLLLGVKFLSVGLGVLAFCALIKVGMSGL